jgi:NAD-dependent deacetylase
MPLAEVRDIIDATGAAPRCACGGLVKAAVISFGERLPEEDLSRAAKFAAEADIFLVVGSSLQVQPAASLPLAARRAGARLALINRDATPLDQAADLIVRAPIGAVFAALYPQLVNERASER